MTNANTQAYHYKSCGLDNIYLLNGFHIEDTEDGRLVSFEDIEGLHAVIAHRLVNHDAGLNGKEFRYLRKELELSQRELARFFGCDEQTVGRWERGESEVPGSADRLIRLLYLEYYTNNPHVRALLERVAELVAEEEQMKLQSNKLVFKRHSNEWAWAA